MTTCLLLNEAQSSDNDSEAQCSLRAKRHQQWKNAKRQALAMKMVLSGKTSYSHKLKPLGPLHRGSELAQNSWHCRRCMLRAWPPPASEREPICHLIPRPDASTLATSGEGDTWCSVLVRGPLHPPFCEHYCMANLRERESSYNKKPTKSSKKTFNGEALGATAAGCY
eukprot:1157226-Pelagomonas_calceolata.AAC.2